MKTKEYVKVLFALGALASGLGCSETQKYRDDRYWTEHVAGDLKLQAPVDIYRSHDMEKKAETGGPSTSVIYTSAPDGVFRVVVSRIDAGPGTDVDIDSMITGGNREMSASMGDSSPVVTSSPCERPGFVCRRGSFTGKWKERPFRVLSLYLLRDRTLWSVSVLYPDEADKRYAERVLTSVVLDPAK